VLPSRWHPSFLPERHGRFRARRPPGGAGDGQRGGRDDRQAGAADGHRIPGRDLEQLRSSAHALKGAAGYLAAGPVVQIAGELERIGKEGRLAEAPTACARLEREAARLYDDLRSMTRV